MKKKTLFCFFLTASLLISVPYAFGGSTIAGWWRVAVTINEGDFVTGNWHATQTVGQNNLSYLYISLNGSSSGLAAFIEGDNGTYSLENTYAVYIKNNIVVLVGPSTVDTDGNLTSGSTIVFRTLGGYNIPYMKGFYTRYDNVTDQIVRMGTLNASRVVLLQTIPDEVKKLLPSLF